MEGYSDFEFIVCFNREHDGNISAVGCCYSKWNRTEYHGMSIYYTTDNESASIVMELPATDAGMYHCSVQIRNRENNAELTIIRKLNLLFLLWLSLYQ